MTCGCWGEKLCPIHYEISWLVTKTNTDWGKVTHLVNLGYKKNGQGTLPQMTTSTKGNETNG